MEFRIEAVDAAGKQQSLSVTAADESAALSFAKSRGLFPTDVQEKTPDDPTQNTKSVGGYKPRLAVAICLALLLAVAALPEYFPEDIVAFAFFLLIVGVGAVLFCFLQIVDKERRKQSQRKKESQKTISKDCQSTIRQVQFPTITELAKLRAGGLLSEDEFKAFYEVFSKSTGEKAQDIIGAIKDLHEQHRSGAMSKGNYDSAVWSLLDKLDRKTN